jgi:hypothetical protein
VIAVGQPAISGTYFVGLVDLITARIIVITAPLLPLQDNLWLGFLATERGVNIICYYSPTGTLFLLVSPNVDRVDKHKFRQVRHLSKGPPY